MLKESDVVSVLDDWPHPESGSPEPCIYADDSRVILRYYTQNEKIAVIIFPLVSIFKFGSPNDESLGGHRLINKGLKYYSVQKVENSLWIHELEKQNSIHPRHNAERFLKDKRHYIFTFHDSTLELVANEGEYWKPVIKIASTESEAKKIFIEMQDV
jgi:hypothetical protein